MLKSKFLQTRLASYIPKTALALYRKDYIEAAEGYLRGALGEHFKLEVARANEYTAYIPYWEDEVTGLIRALNKFLLKTSLRGGKQNNSETKKRALEEAIQLVDVDDEWNYARNSISTQLKKPVRELALPDRIVIEAAFWGRIRALIEQVVK